MERTKGLKCWAIQSISVQCEHFDRAKGASDLSNVVLKGASVSNPANSYH